MNLIFSLNTLNLIFTVSRITWFIYEGPGAMRDDFNYFTYLFSFSSILIKTKKEMKFRHTNLDQVLAARREER